tara:strand:+ start:210 stop:728 length:519 start_codon:yes stop_codon:yes gene_type:complete
MAILYKNLKLKTLSLGPLILLYFLSITEIDTQFSNYFEILSFNLQLIIVYYWVMKDPRILGNGHIFFAGIINDVIMGLPMGLSALGYLITALVAMYIRSVTVKMTFFTDWFTFILAIFFSHFVNLILISNFSDLNISYSVIFYNSLFTFIFYPIFWVLFNPYLNIISRFNND